MNSAFDNQAERFDSRAGLPESVCGSIASTISTIADATVMNAAILEIGAGTGQIGVHLAKTFGRYIGVDLSQPMLDVFQDRPTPTDVDKCRILQADGNATWPVDDHSVDVVFSSRTLHLLNRQHVRQEFWRVASKAGAMLMIGRIERSQDDVASIMRQRMRQILKDKGFIGRDGGGNRKRLIEDCVKHGAEQLEPQTAATWDVHRQPIESIESWKNKEGLAGISLPTSLKDEILTDVCHWAVEEFGSLDRDFSSSDSYRIEAVRLSNLC